MTVMSADPGRRRSSSGCEPDAYRHWRACRGRPGRHADAWTWTRMAACCRGYELKLNSYDLGVDIELYDAVQRLRFEHPEVRVRGAHQRQGQDLLRRRQHQDAGQIAPHGVEGELLQVHQRDAQRHRGRDRELRARPTSPRSTAPRRAAATSSRSPATTSCWSMTARRSVSLPELPLLGVLPGTGGLTRLTDKRHVRRDLADYFSHPAEGVARPEGGAAGGSSTRPCRGAQWRAGRRGARRASWRPPGPAGPPEQTGDRS